MQSTFKINFLASEMATLLHYKQKKHEMQTLNTKMQCKPSSSLKWKNSNVNSCCASLFPVIEIWNHVIREWFPLFILLKNWMATMSTHQERWQKLLTCKFIIGFCWLCIIGNP